jgi:hypothetical protein
MVIMIIKVSTFIKVTRAVWVGRVIFVTRVTGSISCVSYKSCRSLLTVFAGTAADILKILPGSGPYVQGLSVSHRSLAVSTKKSL